MHGLYIVWHVWYCAVAGVMINPTTLTTSEDGSSATFDITLDTVPTDTVTVTLSPSITSEGSLSTSTITFTTTNALSPQTVTVTGVDDSLDDGDITYTIVTSTTSSDTNYNGIATSDIAVTNEDDDTGKHLYVLLRVLNVLIFFVIECWVCVYTYIYVWF